jgi:hypothetical protein
MKERGYQTAKRGQGGRVCWLGIKAKNQNEKQEERYHEEEFD